VAVQSERAQDVEPRRPGVLSSLGHVPALALCAGIGLLICSVANSLGRAGQQPTELIYWAGLLVIAVPIFFRLASSRPGYRERLVLVILLGLSLYGVKVVRDSIFFNFSDEFVHAYNAQQIAAHHHLYHFNPVLPVTAHFPGLEGATSALMTLTGMSSYGAGILLIGAARLTFMIGLFLLFARLSGSARIAGLGAAVYTGASNFLFWGAQFSYESLSLPLMVVVLMAFAEREAAPASWRRSYAVPILLGIVAITVTHHVTSYGVALILVALAILYRALGVQRPNPWPLAVFAVTIAVGWLLIAARSTTGYLGPVLGDAITAVFKTASGETAPRQLFHSSSSAALGSTPLLARLVALLAIALLAGGFLLGLREVWRRHRSEPLVLVLGIGAIGFFAALGLRFAPAAWETGNRASEFLFIGLAFVAAYGALDLMRRAATMRSPRLGLSKPPRPRALLTAGLAVVLVGGAISGWPWDVQLARPLRVKAQGAMIDSESLALAEWSSERLPGARFAAPEADARVLLNPGGQTVFAGQGPDVEDILTTRAFQPWQFSVLRRNNLRFVVADRRKISEDTLRGFYFTIPGTEDELLPKEVVAKFSQLGVGRPWDSGRIVLFDMENRR
jgi:hypothetical protein